MQKNSCKELALDLAGEDLQDLNIPYITLSSPAVAFWAAAC